MAPSDLMTAEDLLGLAMPGKQVELVRGQLVVREPPGILHGAIAEKLARRLGNFAESHALGLDLAAETGFWLFSNPDTVRGPDVGFIRAERVPRPLPRRGYSPVAPDLAAEILSPSERAGEVLAKVADWLTAGARLVWVVDPDRRVARVYRADGSEAMVAETDALDGEDVLPGFTFSLAELLDVG
jgi:Uma2 family endonuclease